jgi:hypothetical protein
MRVGDLFFSEKDRPMTRIWIRHWTVWRRNASTALERVDTFRDEVRKNFVATLDWLGNTLVPGFTV